MSQMWKVDSRERLFGVATTNNKSARVSAAHLRPIIKNCIILRLILARPLRESNNKRKSGARTTFHWD